MNLKKGLLLLLAVALLLAAFFAFDLGRYLTLVEIKTRQAQMLALYAQSPITVLLAFGVLYVAVTALSLPGAVPLTSSEALNNATLPFGLALAGKGLAAIAGNPHLAAGLNVHRGRLTHKAAAESLGLPSAPAEQAIAG